MAQGLARRIGGGFMFNLLWSRLLHRLRFACDLLNGFLIPIQRDGISSDESGQ